MITPLDKQILEYLPFLGKEEKQSLLSVIKSFLHLKEESSTHISREQYDKEIEDAEREYEKGDYIGHDEMKKKLKQW